MLENPSFDSAAAAVNIATVKRYAPPNQRNRLLGRRKSVGDRLEPASTYANDGERNPNSSTKANSMVNHGYAGVNKGSSEIHCSRLIPLHGCSDKRPVLYTKKNASAWGRAFLPQLPTVSSGLRRDFSSELQQAMNNANSGP